MFIAWIDLLGGGFLIIFFLPEKAYRVCLSILLAFDFLFFSQITYFNGKLSLSGDNLGKVDNLFVKIINLVFWFFIFALFIVLSLKKDKKKYIKTTSLIMCIAIFCAQAISTITPIVANDKFFEIKNSSKENAYSAGFVTYKNLDKYSKNDNIYYFIIDRFDELYAEAVYEYKNDYFDSLTGFTWFQDNIAMYGHTFPAVAYAMTGNEYSCEKSREDYLKNTYISNNYLKELSEAGYEINLYTDSYYSYTNSSVPDYVINKENFKTRIKNKFDLACRMVELGVFVGSPLFCKPIFNNISTSSFDKLSEFISKDNIEAYFTSNDEVASHISSMEFSETDTKKFNLIHIEGCHGVTSNNPNEKNSSISLLNKSFTIINKFLDNLRDKGLYKSATIIITGDHSSPYNDSVGVYNERRTALFFKPSQTERDANEGLKISQNKVEQKNIMPTIFDSIGVTSQIANQKGDKSLFLTDSESRKHCWHTYCGDVVEYVYEIKGAGKDFNNWKEISKKTYARNLMN